MKKPGFAVGLLVVVIGGALAFVGWNYLQRDELPDGFAASNGRIEAVEIDIATKTAGRVEEISVNDGDFVTAGDTVAQMETATLKARLREAEAALKQARIGVETAKSLVVQRQAENAAAKATVAQRQAELDAATKQLTRTEELATRGTATLQKRDDDRASFQSAKAAVSAAEATLAGTDAAIGYAKAQVISAEAAVEAGEATLDRIRTDIADTTLTAPRDGRVQYRVAQPGEVIAAGGTVVNIVDLADVYMTFFLPTSAAGRIAIGAEARIVLDAAPQYVVPAEISYVADVAQFTPKTVETEEERQKLTFRLKAKVDAGTLKKYIRFVKTGLPGMAYVRLNPEAEWPEHLAVRLPDVR
ncbi:HlyD family secretion protein [Rhodobium gokarnense]|uniref:HlyD family secretion protein n=1 Tax=Rhodobium gokarnense TaxID=364296 RepID=A0ABT3HG53_9HYPH|nr:HlyD family efflux transporter periplasmic adaptor subunit [Rhodobium gokarnense]MCW2309369.1 HlyD family secretion protein [Rhodobium gokarnense]